MTIGLDILTSDIEGSQPNRSAVIRDVMNVFPAIQAWS